MAFGLWDVKGSFIIPGTRERASFSQRIGAVSRQKASEDLAPVLNDRFRRELPEGQCFSKHWAMMNLRWEPFQPKKFLEEVASHSEPTKEEA